MSFSLPNLGRLVQDTREAFKTHMPGSDAWLWPNNVYVSAKVMAGAVWELYGRLRWCFTQSIPDTAEGWYLERWAAIWGITRKAATQARGMVQFQGTTGTLIPGGTVIGRNDGVQYATVTAEYVTGAGFINIEVEAIKSGSKGNTPSGAEMTLAATIPGINASCFVTENAIGSGTDCETDTSLRNRMLETIRRPVGAGSVNDYINGTLEVPGVTRVWVEGSGYNSAVPPGEVYVYFMMDDTYADGIPLPSDVALVLNYLQSIAPATATVRVFAPTPVPMNITVKGLYPASASVIQAVEEELRDMIFRKAKPGMPNLPFNFSRSWIWQAVSNASGEQYHEVEFPNADVQFNVGQIPIFNSVTFAP